MGVFTGAFDHSGRSGRCKVTVPSAKLKRTIRTWVFPCAHAPANATSHTPGSTDSHFRTVMMPPPAEPGRTQPRAVVGVPANLVKFILPPCTPASQRKGSSGLDSLLDQFRGTGRPCYPPERPLPNALDAPVATFSRAPHQALDEPPSRCQSSTKMDPSRRQAPDVTRQVVPRSASGTADRVKEVTGEVISIKRVGSGMRGVFGCNTCIRSSARRSGYAEVQCCLASGGPAGGDLDSSVSPPAKLHRGLLLDPDRTARPLRLR